MRNSPEYIISFWGCALLGAIPVLVNPWLTDEQLIHCVNKTQCEIHIVDAERADRFESLNCGGCHVNFIVVRPHEGKGSWEHMRNWNSVFTGSRATSRSWELEPDCKLEDDCLILFLSGTTSMPKAVAINAALVYLQST